MPTTIDLPERYRQQLLTLLEAYVPEAEVWAYGSRVNGTNHEGSDLDIVLRGPDLCEIETGFFELLEALEESTIPILVDAFDWARLPESFLRAIERRYVVLKEARPRRAFEMVDEHGRTAAINLDSSQCKTVTRLLQGYVPGCEVRAYGPRAAWTAERHTRLDLAVLGAEDVSPDALSGLRTAFQRSHLPFNVNVADWSTMPDELRREIDMGYLVLQPATSPRSLLSNRLVGAAGCCVE